MWDYDGIHVNSTWSVADFCVTHSVFSFVITGIPASQQHLVWHSNELKNEQSLQDCSICSGATLQLILSMQGGPINSRRGMIFMINLTTCCLFHVTDVFVLRTCSAFFSEICLGI